MALVPLLIGRGLAGVSLLSRPLAGRLAFRLFTTPGRRAWVRPAERAVHRQAHTTTLPLADRRVVVYRWGDGTRPVLMLHGWGGRGSRFAALVTALRAHGFTPLTFDAPGHGSSTGRSTHLLDYAAIVHQLHQRYGRFEALVGHSFGGLAAFHALRTGATARRLATIASPCDFDLLPAQFTRVLRVPALEEELRRRCETFFAGQRDIWQRLSAWHRADDIDPEILAVHDLADPTVPVQQAHRIAEAFGARARVLTTNGLGHGRILSAAYVVDQVVGFVTGGTAAYAGGRA